ncbi:MAG: hypothetical protein HY420_04340 [Candidatus Kerfeldbacteria bacterium]|nr:hypothetical protein [Candidatus Kerfeldbacteria bacterium]
MRKQSVIIIIGAVIIAGAAAAFAFRENLPFGNNSSDINTEVDIGDDVYNIESGEDILTPDDEPVIEDDANVSLDEENGPTEETDQGGADSVDGPDVPADTLDE